MRKPDLSPGNLRWRLAKGRVHASNAWYRAAGRRISGTRQQYRNWLNRRAVASRKRPLPDRVTSTIGSRAPVYRNRINPATGRTRRDDAPVRLSGREAKAYARIDTSALEWHRDHAASHDLTALREHYDTILAARARRGRRSR